MLQWHYDDDTRSPGPDPWRPAPGNPATRNQSCIACARSGDEIEFTVDENGTVMVRGYTSIPTDQAWFFTPEWQAGEREAQEQLARGEGDYYDNDEDFLSSFDS